MANIDSSYCCAAKREVGLAENTRSDSSRRHESLACIWIFHSGAARKPANIDQSLILSVGTSHEARFVRHRNASRQPSVGLIRCLGKCGCSRGGGPLWLGRVLLHSVRSNGGGFSASRGRGFAGALTPVRRDGPMMSVPYGIQKPREWICFYWGGAVNKQRNRGPRYN